MGARSARVSDDPVRPLQPHVNSDRYEGRSIRELCEAASIHTGEQIRVIRFQRFAVGQAE